ncbi:hypothetical protein U1Q18_039097 [Sarracenia purpurea var. burkii]
MRKAERGARFGSARLPLDKMLERNVDSWTTMVSGGAQGMHRANIGLDQVALPVTISACAGVDDLRLGSLSFACDPIPCKENSKGSRCTTNKLSPKRVGSRENGAPIIRASGLVDIKSAADTTDPTLPSTPKKPTLYYPSATRLIAVSAWGLAYGPHSYAA